MKSNVQKPTPLDFEELLSGMTSGGKFDYLKVILTKTKNNKWKLGEKYLIVTRNGFSVIKLLDFDFDGRILMKFQCTSTGMIRHIVFDTNDKEFKFLLLCWDDIKGMVFDDNGSIEEDELLEFDF